MPRSGPSFACTLAPVLAGLVAIASAAAPPFSHAAPGTDPFGAAGVIRLAPQRPAPDLSVVVAVGFRDWLSPSGRAFLDLFTGEGSP